MHPSPSMVTFKQALSDQLTESSGCRVGLMTRNSVLVTEKGPTNGPEILVPVYLDDPTWGFWYGHIFRHPNDPACFVAVLIWSTKLLNGGTEALIFRRLHHWIAECQEYHPATIQHPDDAYAERHSLASAVDALKIMLQRFDIDRRTGLEGSQFSDDPIEVRVFQIFGLLKRLDWESVTPPVPTQPNLT